MDKQTKEIAVKYWKLDPAFGWGWSCTPTGEDAHSIETPTRPDVTGTITQIQEHIKNDRAFSSLGGAFYNTAWFYDGNLITHIWDYACTQRGETPDDDTWEYTWIDGFDPASIYEGDTEVKIRVLIQEVAD